MPNNVKKYKYAKIMLDMYISSVALLRVSSPNKCVLNVHYLPPDKLAALWPFLGICAEVAILVIIIFVYENRRSKKLEELDAREEADHL